MLGGLVRLGYVVITLLTRPLCAMCLVMAKWLTDLKVAYREIDVAAAPAARRMLRKVAGGELAVPTLVFEDGRVLVEPTRKALLEALRERSR